MIGLGDLLAYAGELVNKRTVTAALASGGGYNANPAIRTASLPAAVASLMAGISLGVIAIHDTPLQPIIVLSRSAEQVFGDFSAALSAPDVTYYVNVATGSDANDGLSTGSPFASVSAAITALNNNGAANNGKIIATGGSTPYHRNRGFVSTVGTVSPTKDVAFIAVGGDVTVTTCDSGFAPTADGTYTNCYSQAVANADFVVDLLGQPDRFNNYPRLINLSTPALVDKTPGSWTISGGTVYIHRADGLQPTSSNTRLYRPVYNVLLSSNVNVYFGSTDGSRFNLEGGNTGGVRIAPSTLGATKHCVMMTNVDCRYGFRGVSTESFHGYVVNWGGYIAAEQEDGTNPHNTLFSSAAECVVIDINVTAVDCGWPGHTSCNPLTAHDNVLVMALGGTYAWGSGGTCRTIDQSVAVMIASTIDTDRGDNWAGGGTSVQSLFRTAATAYLDGVRFIGKPRTWRIYVDDGGVVYEKNPPANSTLRTFGNIVAGWPA